MQDELNSLKENKKKVADTVLNKAIELLNDCEADDDEANTEISECVEDLELLRDWIRKLD